MTIQADTPSAPANSPPAWPWWLLRAVFTLQAVDAFLQPVFEGRFLSGDFPMLAAHRTNASVVGVLAFVGVLVAILAWRIGRAPGTTAMVSAGLTTAVVLQVFLGYSRNLGVHIPLGVLIVGLSGVLAWWSWTHGPARLTARDES